MTRQKITIEFEIENPDGVDLGTMFRDAIHEFVSLRSPVSRYVAERYKTHPQDFQDRKLASVSRRIKAAYSVMKLHVVEKSEKDEEKG